MTEVRRANCAGADAIGRLLHDFHTEFDELTRGPGAIAERVPTLLADGEITVLIAGADPLGLAVLRFDPSLWKTALECNLEELYVVPDRRGQGLGRALMDAAIDVARHEGAGDMSLGTGEEDVAARALYESRDRLGFTCDVHGDPPDFVVATRDEVTILMALCDDAERVVPNWRIVPNVWNVFIRVDDVEAIYEEVQRRGAEIDYTLYDAPSGFREFGVQDPDGHDIAIAQPIETSRDGCTRQE